MDTKNGNFLIISSPSLSSQSLEYITLETSRLHYWNLLAKIVMLVAGTGESIGYNHVEHLSDK